jgi:DNA-binding NarL/FixJ family response regulator
VIRLLVADDHPVVRQGLCAMLDVEPDLEVVADVGDGQEAVRLTMETEPDVVLMDVQMPGLDGIGALREILRQRPQTKVVMLTTFGHENYVVPSFKAGALAYLLKDVSRAELTDAIRRVAAGESLLDRPSAGAPGSVPISHRELEVLACMAQEMNNREIATTLYLSENTVKTHVSHLLAKLGAVDRSGAVLRAWKQGLLPVGSQLRTPTNHSGGG